ncbi:MAG: metal-dependent hydrolase [Armatimonadetes bacterium]|nr:metal-dependent hydrolase [Armatimonadota bacterium]
MAVQIRFFGVAAYEIITSWGQHILIDPFLDENPGTPVKSEELEQVDLILVSHAALDHMGDTEALARRTGAPVVCGGEIKAYLMAQGVPESQVRATTWGIAVEVAGIRIQPVECHHWSQIRMPDGTYASGVPMGFVVYAGPDVRFYHYGDTAIFGDMRLIKELYRPTIGCVGVTQPVELLSRVSGPGQILTGEMSPKEAAIAAQWLGLETVLPCHYIEPDCDDVREFERCLEETRSWGENVPDSVVLKPGEVYALEQSMTY